MNKPFFLSSNNVRPTSGSLSSLSLGLFFSFLRLLIFSGAFAQAVSSAVCFAVFHLLNLLSLCGFMDSWNKWWTREMESRPLDSAEERMSFDVLSVIPKDEVTSVVDVTQISRSEGLSGNREIIVAVSSC